MPQRHRQTVIWAAFVAATLVAGSASAIFDISRPGAWYEGLAKPAANPPGFVFGLVWPVLYVMIGAAAYRIWRYGTRRQRRTALTVWVVQMALNIAWPVVFFTAHAVSAAMAVLAVLWLAILATIERFGRIDRAAAWLLVPYWLWVSFAGYLNWQIMVLNAAG